MTANSSEKPWYEDGLRFECTQCGDCCTGAPGYVWVNKEEIERLAAHLGITVAAFEKRYVRKIGIRKSLVEFSNGDCVFFDGDSQVRRVRCPTSTVPNMALLGVKHPNYRILGDDVRNVPRQRQGASDPA